MEFCNGAGRLLVKLVPGETYEFANILRETGLNRQTLYNRLRVLEESGLIESWVDNGPPQRRLIRVTKKGEKIRELLIKIYELLDES